MRFLNEPSLDYPFVRKRQLEKSQRFDDLTLYAYLAALTEELDVLAERCWSPAAGTTVLAAARLIAMVREVAVGRLRC